MNRLEEIKVYLDEAKKRPWHLHPALLSYALYLVHRLEETEKALEAAQKALDNLTPKAKEEA